MCLCIPACIEIGMSAPLKVSKGLKPICYISAGSAENWRPDFKNFSSAALGKPLDGWGSVYGAGVGLRCRGRFAVQFVLQTV